MANNRLSIEQILAILRMTYQAGQSQRTIAKSLSLSRATVSDYVQRSVMAGLTTWPLSEDIRHEELENKLFPNTNASRNSKLARPDYSKIHSNLKLAGATLQRLHLEYLEENAGGLSYSQFCTCYRDFKFSLKKSLRVIHMAGDKVFVDYSGMTMPIYNTETGEQTQAQIFVGVLGASNYIYAEAVESQCIPNWIGSHVRMFQHFGCVPNIIVCDNLKSAVTEANRTDPTLNSSYADFAEHYGCVIIPARAYKPQDKSKAEGGVLIIQRWILFRLRKQKFTNLADLNKAIAELLVDVNNRKFQKLPGTRLSQFNDIDKPAMKPLNPNPYEYREFEKGRVDNQYHVCVDDHYYSAPHTLATKQVDIIKTEKMIEICFKGRRMASHPRSYVKFKVSTRPEHMPPSHDHFVNWNAERDLEWAKTKGQYIHKLMEQLLMPINHPLIGYRVSNTIISLVNKHGENRMESVCEYALSINVKDIKTIKTIMKTNMDLKKNINTDLTEANFIHENLRKKESYS